MFWKISIPLTPLTALEIEIEKDAHISRDVIVHLTRFYPEELVAPARPIPHPSTARETIDGK